MNVYNILRKTLLYRFTRKLPSWFIAIILIGSALLVTDFFTSKAHAQTIDIQVPPNEFTISGGTPVSTFISFDLTLPSFDGNNFFFFPPVDILGSFCVNLQQWYTGNPTYPYVWYENNDNNIYYNDALGILGRIGSGSGLVTGTSDRVVNISIPAIDMATLVGNDLTVEIKYYSPTGLGGHCGTFYDDSHYTRVIRFTFFVENETTLIPLESVVDPDIVIPNPTNLGLFLENRLPNPDFGVHYDSVVSSNKDIKRVRYKGHIIDPNDDYDSLVLINSDVVMSYPNYISLFQQCSTTPDGTEFDGIPVFKIDSSPCNTILINLPPSSKDFEFWLDYSNFDDISFYYLGYLYNDVTAVANIDNSIYLQSLFLVNFSWGTVTFRDVSDAFGEPSVPSFLCPLNNFSQPDFVGNCIRDVFRYLFIPNSQDLSTIFQPVKDSTDVLFDGSLTFTGQSYIFISLFLDATNDFLTTDPDNYWEFVVPTSVFTGWSDLTIIDYNTVQSFPLMPYIRSLLIGVILVSVVTYFTLRLRTYLTFKK